MKNNYLTKEIIHHVAILLGIGKNDFVLSQCQVSTINIEYERAEIIQHIIYGAEAELNEFKIQLLIADLTYNNAIDYLILVNSGPKQYLLTLNKFYVWNNSWQECGIQQQAAFLIAMDRIQDFGISWKKKIELKDKIKILEDFLEKNDD